MALSCGIVGLPNVGKSTLFNCLSSAKAEAANYPFCTIEPNVGMVDVPDSRLAVLCKIFSCNTPVATSMSFVDIAGLVKGASLGEGLGNKFLSHIGEVSALCHVVRCFEDENITHVDNSIDPVRDIETIETELLLRDLETVSKWKDKSAKNARSGQKEMVMLADFYKSLFDYMETGKSARHFEYDEKNDVLMKAFSDLHLLTRKPVLFVANVDENGFDPESNGHLKSLQEFAQKRGDKALAVCAKWEEEMVDLSADDKVMFMEEMGMSETGLERIIHGAFDLLGLMTYLTAGEKEVRAWPIKKGFTAKQAAGVIHTDFEKGFIKAEVISYDDLKNLGSEAACREAGKVRLEGKEYLVKDGDVMHFRFNV